MHVILGFLQVMMTHMTQNTACNKHHSIEQQLSRWLLQVIDRIQSLEFAMTQAMTASMLGVRRESVTAAAGYPCLIAGGLNAAPANATRWLDEPTERSFRTDRSRSDAQQLRMTFIRLDEDQLPTGCHTTQPWRTVPALHAGLQVSSHGIRKERHVAPGTGGPRKAPRHRELRTETR
jgi:hypothetical protein